MTAAAVARRARRQLQALSRPAGAFDASRYFRAADDLEFFNVGSTAVRSLAAEIVRAHPEWTLDDAMPFADVLLPDVVLEVKGLGVEVVARYRHWFEPRLLRRWKRWLANGYSSNWATTDAICGALIGPLLRQHPALIPEVQTWVRHRSLWVRRAAAVSLVGLSRRGVALDAAYEVAAALHPDPADLIHKAVGWLLREAGKADMPRLERYLREHNTAIPRTTVRYAIERFPPARRQDLLAATRAQEPGRRPRPGPGRR